MPLFSACNGSSEILHVCTKVYEIRGDKDKDNNETPKKQGPMNTGAEAEVQVPNFPAFAKVFSNGSCALW